MDYQGKLAFITGGSSGIGLAIAKELAARGSNVLLIARNEEKLAAAREEISSHGSASSAKIETLPLDVSDPEQVTSKLSSAMQSLGVPDIVVASAGHSYPAYFEDTPFKQFQRMLDTNIVGVWNVLQVVVPEMKKRQSGSIAMVSSIVGFMSFVGYSGYSVTKFGVCGLAESLRNELRPFGIRVKVLFPPDTDTPGLAEENKTKPYETNVTSGRGSVNLASAETVAKVFMKGFEKKRFFIFQFEGWFIYLVFRLLPGFVRWFTDNDYQKARKELAKQRVASQTAAN